MEPSVSEPIEDEDDLPISVVVSKDLKQVLLSILPSMHDDMLASLADRIQYDEFNYTIKLDRLSRLRKGVQTRWSPC